MQVQDILGEREMTDAQWVCCVGLPFAVVSAVLIGAVMLFF